jgi:hypothetical protein
MSIRVCTVLVLGLVLLIVSPALAQEDVPSLQEFERNFTAASFYAENDSIQLPGRDEDRNYTGGFGFQFSGNFVEKAHLDAPLRGMDRLTRFSKKHEASPMQFHTLLVFGTAFTPDNLNTRRPIRNDRPYASIIGLSARRLTVDQESFDEAWSSELAIGVLGLPVARNLQTWIHRRLRDRSGRAYPYDPLGWQNQISDGGEPTALYRVGYERRLLGAQSGPDTRKHFQLSGGFAGSAGYYTNVNLAANARLGWFTSDFWEFTAGALEVGNQVLGNNDLPRWELFVFAGARPRLNFYNALLQGQFRDSVHTVDLKHTVFEWDLGVSAFIPKARLRLTWNALAGRTSEFEGGPPRTHTWGSVSATYVVPVRQP